MQLRTWGVGAVVLSALSVASAWAQVSARTYGPSSVESVLILDSNEVSMSELFAQEYDYPSTGTELGRGWNSFLSQPAPAKCVTGVETPLSVNFNSVTYSDVFDREQLMSSMRVAAKASFGSVASARASYSRDVKLDRSQRNIVATVDVILDGTTLAPQDTGTGFKRIALLPEALAVLTKRGKSVDERITDFYRMCGDSYVSAIHNGGRLNAFFFLSLSESEVKETLKASAKGSYGGFSGSASAQSTVQRNKTNNALRVDQVHWGGPAGVGRTGDEMLTRIDRFAKLEAKEAKPFTVWTSSYRQVVNWPPEFQYTGLTARAVSLMAGQVWRLQELADLYADAATAPHRYYFPFTQGEDVRQLQRASVTRADALSAASACMQNLAMFCALRTKCDIKDVFKPETLGEVCPALKDNDEAFRTTVGSAMTGTQPSPALASAAPQLSKELRTTNYKLFRAPVDDGKGRPAGDLWLTPAEMYYRLLAEAPIPRSWTGANHDTRDALDATRQLEWYCAIEQLSCGEIAYPRLAGSSPPANGSNDAKALLKTWVVRTRLLPLSVAYCREAGHPMCLSQAKLASIVDALSPEFGEKRNFALAPPPPPPPPPAPKAKPPRYDRPCFPGRAGCPPV